MPCQPPHWCHDDAFPVDVPFGIEGPRCLMQASHCGMPHATNRTEAEWEFAARGGLEGTTFVWGDKHLPKGKAVANTWQGEFPWQNLLVDRFEGKSPVGSFPPNGYGPWTCLVELLANQAV